MRQSLQQQQQQQQQQLSAAAVRALQGRVRVSTLWPSSQEIKQKPPPPVAVGLNSTYYG
jgi:hypothetical protein